MGLGASERAWLTLQSREHEMSPDVSLKNPESSLTQTYRSSQRHTTQCKCSACCMWFSWCFLMLLDAFWLNQISCLITTSFLPPRISWVIESSEGTWPKFTLCPHLRPSPDIFLSPWYFPCSSLLSPCHDAGLWWKSTSLFNFADIVKTVHECWEDVSPIFKQIIIPNENEFSQ